MSSFKIKSNLDIGGNQLLNYCVGTYDDLTSVNRNTGYKFFYVPGSSENEWYRRELIFDGKDWRAAAYLDDIDKVNEKLDLIFGDELDTDTIIDSWKEVQDFLAGIEDTKTLMTMLDDKLSKSEGGTITGKTTIRTPDFGNQLCLDITTDSSNLIRFQKNGTNMGFLGFNSSDEPIYADKQGQSSVLLHQGNYVDLIGSTYLKTDGSNGMNYGATISWGDENKDQEDYEGYSTGFRLLHYNASSKEYRGGIHVGTRYGWQLAREARTERMHVRYIDPYTKTWGDWKIIAFTDSTVAAAKRLVDSNNSAVVHIGESGFYVGDNTYKTLSTSLMGNSILFRTGASALTAMTITDEGNVLIKRQTNNLDAIIGTKGLVHIEGGSTKTALGSAPANGLTIGYDTIGGLAQWIHETNFSGNIQAMNLAGTATAYALNLNPLGGAVNVGGNLAPNANNSLSLGTSSYRWSDVYSVGGNFSGRVLIGGAVDDGETALQVNGGIALYNRGYVRSLASSYSIEILGNNNELNIESGNSGVQFINYRKSSRDTAPKRWMWYAGSTTEYADFILGHATFNGGALIPTGQKLTIGDANGDHATIEYDANAKAIKVDGNLFTTGTNASGGKADDQSGNTSGGSAEVYKYDLGRGEQVYEIQNVKGDVNVNIQVYEWNGNSNSWDMILTDVSVNETNITVTFGRPTSVDHMVTVV